jgi:dTDP-4-dehydrorhamnose 3,5-epimerase
MSEAALPQGVEIIQLKTHNDARGSFTELLRLSWTDFAPAQFNYVRSKKNVLRGVHVHITHRDYLIFSRGEALLGLKDLRHDSPTFMCGGLFPFSGENLQAILVPPGVAHGFYYLTEGEHIYLVDHYHNMADELGCRFDDPDLDLKWPNLQPLLSERDVNAGSLKDLLLAHQFSCRS